jgi:hypothetical protein
VKRRLREQCQRVAPGDGRREPSPEVLIDHEPGVVLRDVEVAKKRGQRRDVHRDVAVREHGVDRSVILPCHDRVDGRVERRREVTSDVVDQGDDDVRAVVDPVALGRDDIRSHLHGECIDPRAHERRG